MTTTQLTVAREFLEVAALLGHDRDTLLAGGRIRTRFEISSFEHARQVLCRANDEQRARRGRTFYDAIAGRQRLPQGLHDRAEAYVFADGDIQGGDVPSVARRLPQRAQAVSALHCVVAAGAELDLSVRAAAWGLPDTEETYCVANFGTLVLGPGARVVVRGNVFSLVCQRLINLGADGTIAIMPTPFTFGHRDGPSDGRSGARGRSGRHGEPGVAPRLGSTVLGPLLLDPPDPRTMAGGDGEPGTAGGPGEPGHNGGACKIAEITLRHVEGEPVVVFAQPGRGGDGGDGGPGGDGGNGGDGAPAYRTLDGAACGGAGGRGGAAGAGGRAGAGGHGGIFSNIYVTVPAGQEHLVRSVARSGEPGAPGNSGPPGRPGRGATPGRPAEHGRAARPALSRGAPPIFVNERC